MHAIGAVLSAVAAGTLACGEMRGPDAAPGLGVAGADTSDDSGSAEVSSVTGDLRLDVAGEIETEGVGDEGDGSTACRHVDALFAFDVSGSMAGEIAAMSDAGLFADFRDTLMDAGDGLIDFQLGVMADAPAFPWYHDTTGPPDHVSCNFSDGANYMTSSSPDLEEQFACLFTHAAGGEPHVGAYGGPGGDTPLGPGLDYLLPATEMPARSAALSVSHPMALQVNAGFLRTDAVLLVVVITDEDDGVFVDGVFDKDPPMSEVVAQMTEIHDQLVAAKGGDPKKVVFVGIGAGSPGGCVGPYGDTIQQAEHLQLLVDLFAAADQGIFVDLCVGGLEAGVAAALDRVDRSCEEFMPEG